MRILVLGSGGREHAIVQKLSSEQNQVFATGSNAGIIDLITAENCFELEITDPGIVLDLARKLEVDLVVIGPEGPLVSGVADALRGAGILTFGPTAQAAQIEASKSFANELMAKLDIPTARSVTCVSIDQVINAISKFGAPYVIKDDGLAAGKGVVVTSDKQEALGHAESCLKQNSRVVVEEFLEGEEVSVLCVTDGHSLYPLAAAQDYKRRFDGDLGPNTGGMGAYTPVPWFSESMQRQVVNEIALPVIAEMNKQGNKFIGVLYCGLIRTVTGLKVIEFNARFGDPETQVVLATLTSSLTELLHAAASGKLHEISPPNFAGAAVTVVIAASGYPENVRHGDEILIQIPNTPERVIFHAGTKLDNGVVKTAGGRVMAVTGIGSNIATARKIAYQGVAGVTFAGMQYRSDIGLGRGE